MSDESNESPEENPGCSWCGYSEEPLTEVPGQGALCNQCLEEYDLWEADSPAN